MKPDLEINGFKLFEGLVTPSRQQDMVDALRSVAAHAPFRQPVFASGKKMSVKMTAAGDFGWLTGTSGYAYSRHQPDGSNWPEIPRVFLDIWNNVSGVSRMPDSCLVNYYGEGAKMGMHQDKDEGDMAWPVVSLSLGDDALFRMGGTSRHGKTKSVWLRSGDVVVMGGDARLAYHGIDRIKFGTSPLLAKGGRLNVTLRVSQ